MAVFHAAYDLTLDLACGRAGAAAITPNGASTGVGSFHVRPALRLALFEYPDGSPAGFFGEEEALVHGFVFRWDGIAHIVKPGLGEFHRVEARIETDREPSFNHDRSSVTGWLGDQYGRGGSYPLYTVAYGVEVIGKGDRFHWSHAAGSQILGVRFVNLERRIITLEKKGAGRARVG